MARALAGILALDFSTTIAGPHCARLLADLGAEVIKIEPPEGDIMRARLPTRNGASAVFGELNAGKKSIVLDLKRPAAAAAARRLVRAADVLVENYRPGVMRRLGLDYEALAPENPRLVYCAISGYGQTGPSALLPAYAPVIHAASGYERAHLAYQVGRTRPDNSGIFIADVLAGTYAYGAIMTALYQRQTTGRGQMIDLSMLETMLGLLLTEVAGAQFELAPAGRSIFGPIEAADGFVTVAVASERTFRALCVAAGREDWIDDARFTNYRERRMNWNHLIDELELWSKARTSAECLAAFDAAGVPASAYRTVAEAMCDPQLAHRGALAEVNDAGGTFKTLNPPFRMSGAETSTGTAAASLGEHTEAVLSRAGLAPAEIAAVMERSAR
ncbi:MAG TPA: CaiB/BaiF CoA-transferase family protein [Stellaceae bacterium]|nr:CaiB/BaiF CoA-transferase family protein [Stellaceae bacterium]